MLVKVSFVYLILLLCIFQYSRGGKQNELNNAPTACEPGPSVGLILVSTIDGYLTSIDSKTGEERWRIKEGPLLESPVTVKKGFTFIPNPKDGQLYLAIDGRVSKLPFTIPLVKVSPCRSNDGILYAGSKKDAWISINRETGERTSVLAPDASSFCPARHLTTIFIGKTEYQISMVDSKHRDRQWNATFVDYSSHLMPAQVDYPLRHFTSSADGRIMTIDANKGQILWEHKFNSMIVNIYLLKKDGMHKLPSTAIGKEVFDRISQNTEKMGELLQFQHNDNSNIPRNLYPTLFVGETMGVGLYAIPAFIDQQTAALSRKYFRPSSLIEGPGASKGLKNNEKKLSHSDSIDFASYNIEDEYLLLGYHETPELSDSRLVSKTIQNKIPVYKDPLEQFLPYIEVEDGNDFEPLDDIRNLGNIIRHCVGNKCFYYRPKTPIPNQLTGGGGPRLIDYNGSNDTEDFKSVLSFIWRKYPFVLVGSILIFVGLLLGVTWQCAKLNTITSLHLQSRIRLVSSANSDLSNGSKSSKSSKTNKTRWSSIRSIFNTLSADVEEALLDDSQWVEVNDQLRYRSIDPLGSGCDGTIVYRGLFQDREVAVKRIVATNCELVEREINHLRESDTHPNVIRYFCSAFDRNFRYLALELCDCNLEEYIKQEKPFNFPQIEKLSILRQVTDGLDHLHSMKIVHRDVKPKNILLSYRKTIRILISDFGLCKTIKDGRLSISKQSGFAGTKGWAAPEAMNVNEYSLTKAIDVFSLGCVFYYVLSDGHHPFGNDVSLCVNILNGGYDLNLLDENEFYTQISLIESMLEFKPDHRPTTGAIVNHPLFWSKERQLQFLMDVSDRIEKADEKSLPIERLERCSYNVFGKNWNLKLSATLQEDLTKHRTYRYSSLRDLLRAMRNKKHHYMELSENLRQSLGSPPDDFLSYFTSKFPRLLMHTFLALNCCAEESVFRNYYPSELKDYSKRLWDDKQIINGHHFVSNNDKMLLVSNGLPQPNSRFKKISKSKRMRKMAKFSAFVTEEPVDDNTDKEDQDIKDSDQ